MKYSRRAGQAADGGRHSQACTRPETMGMRAFLEGDMTSVLVRGSGDIGSAAAHRLFTAGYAVVIHESPQPTATRRGMAFTDAVFDGCTFLEGVEAGRVDDLAALLRLLEQRAAIPGVVVDLIERLSVITVDVGVDTRKRERARPASQLDQAKLTIGLSPGFEAGRATHLVVERAWGDDLGKILGRGTTRPLEGEPQPIAGHTRDRCVYAPVDGVFRTAFRIGDPVRAGQVVAHI